MINIQFGVSPSVYDKEKILMLPLSATGGKGVGVKYDRCREWVAAVFHQRALSFYHRVIVEQSLGPGQRAPSKHMKPAILRRQAVTHFTHTHTR